jgi:hypothetical protein
LKKGILHEEESTTLIKCTILRIFTFFAKFLRTSLVPTEINLISLIGEDILTCIKDVNQEVTHVAFEVVRKLGINFF